MSKSRGNVIDPVEVIAQYGSDVLRYALITTSSPAHNDIALSMQAFDTANTSNSFSKPCYMSSNSEEFWAEGVQAWFDGTDRNDVNDGISTRLILKARLPAMARAMEEAFGQNDWSYRETCPAPAKWTD